MKWWRYVQKLVFFFRRSLILYKICFRMKGASLERMIHVTDLQNLIFSSFNFEIAGRSDVETILSKLKRMKIWPSVTFWNNVILRRIKNCSENDFSASEIEKTIRRLGRRLFIHWSKLIIFNLFFHPRTTHLKSSRFYCNFKFRVIAD